MTSSDVVPLSLHALDGQAVHVGSVVLAAGPRVPYDETRVRPMVVVAIRRRALVVTLTVAPTSLEGAVRRAVQWEQCTGLNRTQAYLHGGRPKGIRDHRQVQRVLGHVGPDLVTGIIEVHGTHLTPLELAELSKLVRS